MNSYEKPTVFISSTVFDFRDLRSALKFWLEERGYKVLLSEYNDFTHTLDKNSYDACIEAVHQAHYFILLIGSRVGGFYNTSEKLTITRMEYREAYKLVKSNRIKMLAFVREELWNVREDRNRLRELLQNEFREQHEISDEEIGLLTNHESNFVNDAEVTFGFLKEVGRIGEMKQAIGGTGDLPVGNWIHRFSDFADILNALQQEFKVPSNGTLRKKRLIVNLRHELIANLKGLIIKLNGEVYTCERLITNLRDNFDGNPKGKTNVTRDQILYLISYMMSGFSAGNNFTRQHIDYAIESGDFLEYDLSSDSYAPSIIHEGLLELQQNMNLLSRIVSKFEIPKTLFKKYGSLRNEPEAEIANIELIPFIGAHDRQQDIAKLSRAIICALDGNISQLANISLNPLSPVFVKNSKDGDSHNEECEISEEDVLQWVNKFNF